ncbi:MAG: DUF1934 domain-containing protein [Oscillospiraceae bacterium]|jgi:uncharacterized beta-barrel protein YwiB (DUF1934 family)|nr:DUF1934 domain-containing protein [Oscillospiraceae bacterium]
MVQVRVWLTLQDAQRDAAGAWRHGARRVPATLMEQGQGLRLRYAEMVAETLTQVELTLAPAEIWVCRTGPVAMRMRLCPGEDWAMDYHTPQGSLPMRVRAKETWWRRLPSGGHLALGYELWVGDQWISYNTLRARWRPAEEETGDEHGRTLARGPGHAPGAAG